MPIVEEALAKINLALHVVGRRPDGYHDLDMLVAFANVGDTVTLERGNEDRFEIDGPIAHELSASTDNLVLGALRGFRALTGQSQPVNIRLTKRLPIASGIGGGSADAAATLRGLCRLHGHRVDDPALATVALSLGADVPMCLGGRPGHILGVGEQIVPTAGSLSLGLLLVNPRVAVSTPAVFRALEQRNNPPLPPLPSFEAVSDLAAFLAAETRNDLEAPARNLAPAIADVLSAVAELPSIHLARMSGSGATCFGIFEDLKAAKSAGDRLAANYPGWWIEPAMSAF